MTTSTVPQTIKSIRILVIENDPLVSRALMMARTYYELPLEVVSQVDNSIDLRQPLENLDPNVVITDIHSSDLNSIAAIQQIKNISPQAKVIVLTTMDHLKASVIAAGADEFLCKYIDINELVTTVIDTHSHTSSYCLS